ncbi:MAG TPA: hypothetical protein PKC28_09700 [Bdellovibrionales bacterium]|nr:hypothetical protein [Bdellovibrionales bacterium]
MRIPFYWLLSLFLMVATAALFAAFSTSLWFLVLGRFPAPMLWLIVIVYMSVTRPLWEATMMVYLLTLVNASFTAFPFEGMLIYSLAMMVILILIRERVFWGGPTFFMLMVGVASLSAPILFWLCSRWFDKNPLFIPEVFDWLIGGLLTLLFSLPVYRLYQWFDKVSLLDAGSEGRVGPR